MSKAFPGLEVQFPVKNAGFGFGFGLWHFSSFLKLNFQAVIKSATSAASPKTKIQESRGASGMPADNGSAGGRRKQLGSPRFLDFGLRGGCASSRLDHGLKV